MARIKAKPSCFISYCHEDTNKQAIQFLVDELKLLAGSDLVFYWDRDLLTGSRLKSFMDQLYTSDAILLLLSPAYKQKVDSRKGGVYEEYQRIMHRLEELASLRRKTNKSMADNRDLRQKIFSLFPYIFVGTGETSCPDAFSDHKYETLTHWHVYKDASGNFYIADGVKKQYRAEFERIIGNIHANHATRAPEYSTLFEEIFGKLFRTVKHEDTKGYLDEDPQIAERLFVKTHAYQELKAQSAYILTGRKGTGKTTLTEYLAKLQPGKYKEHIPIKLDDFELETVSGLLFKPQVASDTAYLIRRERVFRVAWEIFIYVHCMEIVICENKKRGLNLDQQKALPYLEEFIARTFHPDGEKTPLRKPAIYKWALGKLIEGIDEGISNARAEEEAEFLYDLDEHVASETLVESAISKEVLYPFSNILKECRRRFLISLDGFDRNFDEFRRIAKRSGRSESDLRDIVALEKDWVRSLLYLVRTMKRECDQWGLYPLVDFCVTIPKDRCIEIMHDERDTIAYLGRMWEIKWSGIELAIMLRKRLEILFNYSTSNDDAIDRLLEVFEVGMEKLPHDTSTCVAGRDYKLPLFIDVLRHTFWRPRDVLMYFTSIIAAYEYLTKRGVDVDWTVINKKISDTTFDVIDREFIDEFKSTLRNVEKIISEFYGCKQILSFPEFEAILARIDFEFADSVEKVSDLTAKAKFLFEIGFLGLRCSEAVKIRFKLSLDDVFYFNDTGKLERMINDNTWRNCKIVIHPIFCEYLALDTSDQDLTLKYTWEYLRRQEALDFCAY
jgi:energy-coupling factor transporter ATP-binding protein EcfA2